jgi:hypothetical protein
MMIILFRRSRGLGALFVALALCHLMGCQNSPGQVFSPTSDIHVVSMSQNVLSPKEEDSSSGSSSSNEKTITLPQLIVYLHIANGVSVFLDGYTVRYYAANGQSIASGKYDTTGGLTAFIQAPSITSMDPGATGTGSSTGTGSTAGTSAPASAGSGSATGGSSGTTAYAGSVSLEILQGALYTYLSGFDISPVTAKIVLHGRDINDHEITMGCQVTLSTMVEKSTN